MLVNSVQSADDLGMLQIQELAMRSLVKERGDRWTSKCRGSGTALRGGALLHGCLASMMQC